MNPYRIAAESMGFNPYTTQPSYPLDPSKPLQGTVNNQYYNWTRGNLNHYLNPDSIGVPVYEEMVTSDETCYAAMQFLALATLAKFGPYRHKSSKIEDAVQGWLANLATPWLDVLKEQLTCTWAGYSVTEVVADYNGSLVVPTQLQTLHPSDLTFDLHLEGPRKNLVSAVRQYRWQAFQAYLPAEKVIVMSHGRQFGNAYGMSRLRSCWRSWFLKTKMLAAWALVLD